MKINSPLICVNSHNASVSATHFSFLGAISCSPIYHVKKQDFISLAPSRHSRSLWSIQCAVRFRPCIDIHKGKVKQIVGSTLRDSNEDSVLITNYVSDKTPAEFAELYKQDGLTGGHVIMLGSDPLSKSAAMEALHAYPGGLHVGGGINSDNALSYLEEGASHVIVTSYVFNDGKMDHGRLKHLVHMIGKERLVLDLSCRKKDGKYIIVTDRWQKFSDVVLHKETLHFLATYADEFLVHGVDVEGKRLGIDEELVALLGQCSPFEAKLLDTLGIFTYAVARPRSRFVLGLGPQLRQEEALSLQLYIGHCIPRRPEISGGVTTMADLERIKMASMARVDVTVGSALDIFGGDLAYKDVVAWHHDQVTAVR